MLAVDFLSPLGGTPADEDQAMKLYAQGYPLQAADLRAGRFDGAAVLLPSLA